MNNADDWILSYLSFYTNKHVDVIRENIDPSLLQRITRLLTAEGHPYHERVLRKILDPVLCRLPAQARLLATNILKRYRNPEKKVELLDPKDCRVNRTISDLRQSMGTDPFTWNALGSVLCLTHDIENQTGYSFIPAMLRYYRDMNVPATFNFLTDYDYRVEDTMIEEIRESGCEAGLHGSKHEISLAYQGRGRIRKKLTRALEQLPDGIDGYRSPALSNSEILFDVLQEIGFRYDSTLQVTFTFYKSVETCFPYRYKDLDLWEIPLTLQDDVFFRDSDCSENEALARTLEIAEQVRELGGVCVLNAHPHLLTEKTEFFRGLLRYASEVKGVWVCTLGELYRYLQEQWESFQSTP